MSNEIAVLYIYAVLMGLLIGKAINKYQEDDIAVAIASLLGYITIIFFKNPSKEFIEAIMHSTVSICVSIISFICYSTLINEKKHFNNLLKDKEAENEHLPKDVRDNVSSEGIKKTL